MIILAKLDVNQIISIFGIVVPSVIGLGGVIITYLQYRKENRGTAYHIVHGPLEKWKRSSLAVRIFLHRLSAIITLLLVLYFVKQTDAQFVKWLLLGILIFEIFWFFKHLAVNLSAKHTNKISTWGELIPRVVENHVDLRYNGSHYPFFSLLVEALVLTYLCVISGGTGSPFFFLFAVFCALAFYVSYNNDLPPLAIYLTILCSCFLLVFYVGDIDLASLAIPKTYLLEIGPQDKHLFYKVGFLCITMCGVVFLGVTAHFANEGRKQLEAPVRQTKNILSIRGIPIKTPKEDSPVFIIGNNDKIFPKKTLALLPYCARGPRCPIRRDNEKRPPDTPINGEQCRHCKPLCAIGRLDNCQHIAETKVIGSHHKVDEAIVDFLSTHNELTHLIAICCTSRLAKYLPKTKDDKYKNITVIYTPLLTGTDTCLSSTDILHDGRGGTPVPCTSFDADALIDALEKMPKV